MNTAKSKRIIRSIEGAVAAARVLTSGAPGFAAGANASTLQMKQEHAVEVQARHADQPGAPTGARPTPPHRVQPASPTAPGEHTRPAKERPAD